MTQWVEPQRAVFPLLLLPPLWQVLLWELVTGAVPQRGCLREPDVPRECPQEVADIILACMQVRFYVVGVVGGVCFIREYLPEECLQEVAGILQDCMHAGEGIGWHWRVVWVGKRGLGRVYWQLR